MAIKSGLFKSVNGDRRYNAAFFAEYFASFIANGVFPNPSTGLQIMANGDMTVSMRAGKAWINGYYFVNDSDYVLQLDVADGVLSRIDRIVLRNDSLTREIVPVVKKGVYASSPVAPTLQRDADAYELALADVLINNGVINITQANITDLRLNTQLCGIVHGTVNQVDTTTIFNQYQAWFNQVTSNVEGEIREWQAASEQQFMDWFDSLQDILDGDVAANLANRIALLEQDVSVIKQEIGTQSLLTTDKTLKGAINEVFLSGNNVKVDMVDALLQIDPSLPISYDSTWAEIESAVSQISTGIKYASGTGTMVINSSNQLLSVETLEFMPKIVIITSRYGVYTRVTVLSSEGLISEEDPIRVAAGVQGGGYSELNLYANFNQNFGIDINGFHTIISVASNAGTAKYKWHAFG